MIKLKKEMSIHSRYGRKVHIGDFFAYFKEDYIESKTFYKKIKGEAFCGGQGTDQADSEWAEGISE